MHGAIGSIDVLFHGLWVDVRQRFIHPGVVPAQPICCRRPQVFERIELSHKSVDFVILHKD